MHERYIISINDDKLYKQNISSSTPLQICINPIGLVVNEGIIGYKASTWL